MADSEYSVTRCRIVQLARNVRGNSLHLGNHFGNVCNSLKYVCNSQKTMYVCPNRCFLCVTRVDVASTMHDLVGTGLTEPLEQPQPAALADVGENLLMIEEPSSVVPVAPHAAPPPPGQQYAVQEPPPTQGEVITLSMASELTSKNK